MEIVTAAKNKHLVFIYEALGTMMLMFAINIQAGSTAFGQFGIAFMLFACLLIGGPITGAHYNPAVTIGVFITNKHWKEDFAMFAVMISAQFVGSVMGVFLVWVSLINKTGLVPVTRESIPTSEMVELLPLVPTQTGWNCFQIELICTFTFVMINLLVKTQKTSPTSDGFLSCLGVAFTLLAMITISGQKTGGCINPAVAFGQTILEWIQYGRKVPNPQPDGSAWQGGTFYSGYLFMYIGAEVTAAILAGFFHRFHVKTYKEIALQAGENKLVN